MYASGMFCHLPIHIPVSERDACIVVRRGLAAQGVDRPTGLFAQRAAVWQLLAAIAACVAQVMLIGAWLVVRGRAGADDCGIGGGMRGRVREDFSRIMSRRGWACACSSSSASIADGACWRIAWNSWSMLRGTVRAAGGWIARRKCRPCVWLAGASHRGVGGARW